MATKTIPQLPAATSVVAATLFPIVNDPAGTPVTQKATGTQLDAYIRSAGGALTATTLDGSGGALTINTAQADKDVVVSSTGMVNLLFTDAGNNRVGINTATPTVALQVVGTVTATLFSGDGSALTSLPAIATSAFLTVAGNPATPVTANCWYNSTANTFRGYTAAFTAAWSAGASLVAAKRNMGTGMGTISSALVAGGCTSSTDFGATSEKYNGTSWSVTGNISEGRYDLCGAGTTTSALTVGGMKTGTIVTSTVDAYNGSTWSATTSLSYDVRFPGAAGTSSSSTLVAGGTNSSHLSTTSVFNGSSWASGGALPAATFAPSCFGTVSAALSTGGEKTGSVISSDVYSYNGTSWSTGTSLPAGRFYHGISGTLTSCLVYGGYTSSSPVATVVSYNGTAWSATTSLTTARDHIGSVGPSNTSAMAIAGGTPGITSSTEVYTEGIVSSSKTFTVS